jgi:hypothetical protein
MAESELLQTRQEAFLLLAAEYPENEFRRIQRSAPRHHGENEPGKIRMIEIGDAAPFQPLRLWRAALTAFHLALPFAFRPFTRKSGRRDRHHQDFRSIRRDLQGAIMRNRIWLAIAIVGGTIWRVTPAAKSAAN